jgi:4-amino-4-deoxy-L-arabinose transferase-like glycosyltransferase
VRRVAELVALAGLVVAQALLFGRLVGNDTDYDEGVYLSSVDALEDGQRLGEDVFAPQPPAWYLLLRLISLLGADSVRSFHIGMVVVAIATCFAAYLVGRALAGPLAGLAASALLTVAPPFPLYAHRVLADVPPLAAALVSFWLAVESRQRRSTTLAFAGGGVLALALALKPTAVLAVPVFLVLLCWERSLRGRALIAAAVGGTLVGLAFVLAYLDAIGELWESVVVYHRDARNTPPVIDETDELLTFLNWRTPFAWLVVAGLAASVVLYRRRRALRVWALWLWAALSVAFLVYHSPLHENHLLLLPVALAVPAAVALVSLVDDPRYRLVGVGALAVVLAAGYVQQQRRIVEDEIAEEPELVEAAAALREVARPGELVVSDHSIVPFLAERVVAGPLVDTAVLRFQTESLTNEEVMRVLEEWDVTAVVAGRAFAERPELLELLAARYTWARGPRSLRIYSER